MFKFLKYNIFLALIFLTYGTIWGRTLQTPLEVCEYLGAYSEKHHLDYNDPVLERCFRSPLLQSALAQSFFLYRLYKAFIQWDRDRHNPQTIAQARELFRCLAEFFGDIFFTKDFYEPYAHAQTESEIEEGFFKWFVRRELIDHAHANEMQPVQGEESLDYKLPLWLILKYPQILLEYDVYRYPLEVATAASVQDLPEFAPLKSFLERITEVGWQSTSYYPGGTIIIDIRSARRGFERLMNVFPDQMMLHEKNEKARTVEDYLRPLQIWGSQGLWNQLRYKEYQPLYKRFVRALKAFYATHPRLSHFASQAALIAASFVNYYVFVEKRTPDFDLLVSADEAIHQAVLRATLNMRGSLRSALFFKRCQNHSDPLVAAYWMRFAEKLHASKPIKKSETAYRMHVWSAFLSRAILSDFSLETLELIIKLGANVNALNHGETPLMNAAHKPKIMDRLLKRGARVNAKNSFGKTALFYAIQFGDKACVELLIKKGAKVNQALPSLKTFITLCETSSGPDFLLEKVAHFTPLVYAMRYATKDVSNLLIHHGARPGNAPKQRIQQWVAAKK